jgi:hypothetical protein
MIQAISYKEQKSKTYTFVFQVPQAEGKVCVACWQKGRSKFDVISRAYCLFAKIAKFILLKE